MSDGQNRVVESFYDDREAMRARVAKGDHREAIGGLWQEVGALQLGFLKSEGLAPSDTLLDLGCGSLRGGVHYIRYLDAGHYYGLDLSEALLEAGWGVELAEEGLQAKQPRGNLIADDNFGVERFGTSFDKAIAVSVFTHMSLNKIRQCLEKLAPVMNPGGVFYATTFPCPEDQPTHKPVSHGEITTFSDRDPYHYRPSDLEHAARGLPFTVRHIGDWGHPRGQVMTAFHRRDEGSDLRGLSTDEAGKLGAGDDHYRAYVGPPERFDFMSATQFSLLFQSGLRDTDRVLDVGCGSLRLGRLLIPFLREGHYAGIDPNHWLIDEGLDRELGRDASRLKAPKFAFNEDFDASGFGHPFDFVIAQSVATHCGPAMLDQLLLGSAKALAPDGLFLFSYIRDDDAFSLPDDGWYYPGCVGYRESFMIERLRSMGLYARGIDWHHPAASWMVASPSKERLPSQHDACALSGWVMERRSGSL